MEHFSLQFTPALAFISTAKHWRVPIWAASTRKKVLSLALKRVWKLSRWREIIISVKPLCLQIWKKMLVNSNEPPSLCLKAATPPRVSIVIYFLSPTVEGRESVPFKSLSVSFLSLIPRSWRVGWYLTFVISWGERGVGEDRWLGTEKRNQLLTAFPDDKSLWSSCHSGVAPLLPGCGQAWHWDNWLSNCGHKLRVDERKPNLVVPVRGLRKQLVYAPADCQSFVKLDTKPSVMCWAFYLCQGMWIHI